MHSGLPDPGDLEAGFGWRGDDGLAPLYRLPVLHRRLPVRLAQLQLERSQKGAESGIITVGELQLDPLKREVRRQNTKIELPAKEYALLELMMRNPGRVLSKTSILERIYDYSFDPQTNVVDVLVCRLRTRIDKNYDNKFIHTVRGMGYVLRVE